jgi:hypothetical protein
LASPIVEVKIAALSEALKYGDAGLDLIIGVLQDESMPVKFTAYSLLKDRDEPSIKEQLQKYLPIFDFDVITVDSYGKENSRQPSLCSLLRRRLRERSCAGNGIDSRWHFYDGFASNRGR